MINFLHLPSKGILLITFLLGSFLSTWAQQQPPSSCATDEVVRKQFATDSVYRKFIQSVQPSQNKAGDDTTTLYTVPVVFVIYHLGEAVGMGSNVSESALQLQLDMMNEMFAGKRPYYAGPDTRIRFVMARRSLSCGAFNGVARVDARSVPGYQTNGLPYNDGTMTNQLRNLMPDYSNTISSEFVTIRVLHQVTGAGGWANYGGDIFVPSGIMANANTYNTTLAHEMGHALFLAHTFSGSDYDSSSGTYNCPSNNDPERDGDQVADTDPHRKNEPLNGCDAYSETATNFCTGQPFGLIGRNFMSYGCNLKLFTRGQIRRMRSYLTGSMQGLVTSAYLNPPEGDVKAACLPTVVRPAAPSRTGIARVQFQTIDRQTEANPYQNGHYRDYACSDRATVTAGQSYSLVVNGFGRYRRAYLDYNNDGTFNETTELVWASENGTRGLITILTNAVMDRQLRLRIVVDNGDTAPTACSLPGHPTDGSGEVEDYAVRVLPADTPVSLSLGAIVGAAIVCRGQPSVIPISYMGVFGADNLFTVQLSDESGSFNNPTTIGSGAVGPIAIELPSTLPLGSSFKVRVVSSNPVLTTDNSPFLQIGETATATIAGSQTPTSGGLTATLSFSLTGNKPWSFAFTKNGASWGGFGGINQSPFSFTFVPTSSGIYELSSVSNVCGIGTTAGSTTLLMPCSIPTDLFESRYALTTIRTTWSLAWGNTYTLQWKEATATTWTSFTNVTYSGWLISGLEPGKTYRWRIKMHCIDGESDWSEERAFVMDCPTPTYLYMSETTTPTSALLRWNTLGDGFQYTVRWRTRDTGNWMEIPVGAAPTYSLTGLTAGETYQWQVRTNCGPTGTSAYSDTRQFSTSCLPPQLYGAYTISPSSASVNWVQVAGMRYQIRWKPTNSATWIESDTTVFNYANLTNLTNYVTYEWQVRTICSANQSSAYSSSGTFYTQCSTPSQLYSYNNTASSVNLSWYGSLSVPYELRWRPSTSSTWTSITGIVGAYYSLTGLAAGQTYTFQVRTVCSASVVSDFSSLYSVTISCLAVPVSSMAESSVTNTSAQLRWYGSAGTQYVVRWRPQSQTIWQTSTTLTSYGSDSYYYYPITGLTNGMTYEWQVQSLCGGGVTTTSGSRTFVATCQTPNQTGTAQSGTSVSVYYGPLNNQTAQLRWRAVGTTSWTESLTTTYSTYSIPNLQPGTTYEWQVRAVCSTTDFSPYSASSTFLMLCPIPGTFTTNVGPSSALLNWSAVGSRYDLRWRAYGTSTWTTVTSLTATTYSLAGLTTGTSYEWQVQSYCSGTLASGYTYQNTFTANCRLPLGLNESGITGTSAQLSWYMDSHMVYAYQWRPLGSTTWQTSATLTTGYPAALTGLTTGTTYEWRVLTDCEGTMTPTASRTFTAQCGPPVASSLYSYAVSSGGATLSWGGLYGSINTGYRVRYRAIGTTTWVESLTLNSTYTTLRGLANNTTYEWQVQILCDGTGGVYSTLGPAFTTACRVPTAHAVYPGDTYSWLNWSYVESESYSLEYRVQGSPDWTTVSSLTTTTYSLTTIPGTAYEWRVRTICADGSFTAYSNPISFTALLVCDTNEPNNTVQTATPVLGNSFTLTGLCLNRPGDQDWFRWTVNGDAYYVLVNGYSYNSTGTYGLIGQVSNGTLTVSTAPENGSQTDTNMYLYAADGVTYRTSNNDANGSVFSQIVYTLPASCPVMTTVKNGTWSDPTVWSCNRQPVATDTVLILHEVYVPYYVIGRAKQIQYGVDGKIQMTGGGKLVLGQ